AGPTGVDLRLTGLLRFDGDVLGVIDCGLDVHSRGELEVVGSAGRIVLSDPWHAIEPKIVVERGFEREVVTVPGADSYARELEDMAAAIAGERPPRLGRSDALGQARTIDALYRSAEEGRAVALS
ncbi:MAG TPA: Gfo/Idh/MocA family oxidoreductase, partial [Solirubrobacteraceae bacterium]